MTTAANAVPVLAALGTTWRVIGSTDSVDARDNTNTNPFVDGLGVPIFLLDGTQLASGNADLWDGSIAVDFNINEKGLAAGAFLAWTGTGGDGVGDGTHPLGSQLAFTIFGAPTVTTAAQWIVLGSSANTAGAKYYASSTPLTVIPEPGSGVLLSLGLVAMAGARRRTV